MGPRSAASPPACTGARPFAFPGGRKGLGMAITPRSAAGFTLLELSIVLAILGVATAMTFPTISRMTTHARVNQAAMVVAQDLSLASRDRKSTRLNSSHSQISYAVFCLKKKNTPQQDTLVTS